MTDAAAPPRAEDGPLPPPAIAQVEELLDALEAHAAQALARDFDRAWLKSLRQQAAFGYRRLGAEAQALGPDAALLEIGGGPYLLSLLFASQGRRVVTLEPRGLGFEQLWRIQDMVLDFARAQGIALDVVDCQIEEFQAAERFDLAFSVNVFEHIGDIEAGLRHAMAALRPMGALRVLCANYSFPYEPHFAVPIVVNKAVTARLFAGRIARKETAAESKGLWDSLNFISAGRVRAICARHGWQAAFDRAVTLEILKRFSFDPCLRARHQGLAPLVDGFLKSGAGRLVAALPVALQPYMDARITRSIAAD